MKALVKNARQFAKPFRVTDDRFRLKDIDPNDTLDLSSEDKPRAKEALAMGIDVLAALQGLQRPHFEEEVDADGKKFQRLTGLEPGLPGEMPAATYDSFVRDTVAFLEYVAEPAKAKRLSLGIWVILFLLMFTAFCWFLYKEYWKDVK